MAWKVRCLSYTRTIPRLSFFRRFSQGGGINPTLPRFRDLFLQCNVAAVATLNRIAPGRVFLGIGTGNTAMRNLGNLVGKCHFTLSHRGGGCQI